ncbi:MAG: hypothetical protein MHPDNHAH_01270 [Anaerolineales bacterium]|nr:hypothetical protein [Anaerolineales bacterium]
MNFTTRQTKQSPQDSLDPFVKNILKLSAGMGVSQILIVLATPFITRLYDAAEFGAWSIFTALQAVLGSVACFRYELSIITAEDDGQAANQLIISVFFSAISAIIVTLALLFWSDAFALWVNVPGFQRYMYLVPVVVLLTGIGNGLNYWASRAGNFGLISIARLLSSMATIGTPLILGFGVFATESALILGTLFGCFTLMFVLGMELRRTKSLFKSIKANKIWYGIIRFKKYPLYDILASLLNTLSWQLPSFMLARYFLVNTTGYFGLGMRVIFAPFSLVGTSVAQALFQQAEQKRKEGDLSKLVEDITQKLILIALCPMLILLISGADLFAIIFGFKWSEAGVYAQILSPWTFFVFISSPLHVLLNTMERQEVGLVFNIVLVVTRILSLVVGGATGDARITIGLYALTGVIAYGGIALWIINLCGGSLLRIFKQILQVVLWTVLAVGLLIIVKIIWGYSSLIVFLASVLMLAAYYIFLLILKPHLWLDLLSAFSKTLKR